MISIEEVRAAQERLRGAAMVTPLVTTGTALRLKAENLQPIGSFKLRGAYNFIAQIPEADRRRGVIAHSSGNHAQGVAYSAKKLGIPATIVMPSNTPRVKLDATRSHGPEIVMVGPASEERRIRCEELAAERGYILVPPFDHEWIIAGQATCAAEILDQDPDVDLILAPVGGGGLLGGSAAAAKLIKPGVRVIGVEPELAADARMSFQSRRRTQISAEDVTRTIADGLRTQQVGVRNFELIERYVDDIVTVTEDEIMDAMAFILRNVHVVAEPSGAVAAAAWLFHREELGETHRPVAIISGGNAEDSALLAALGRGAAAG